MSECKSCHAAITWAVTQSGKRMPVDATSTGGHGTGNVALLNLDGELTAVVLGPGDVIKAELDDGKRYTSHFVTCPEAAEHRSRSRDARGRGRR